MKVTTIECVGPLCLMAGMKVSMSMSISGITDSMRTIGMLSFVFRNFADVLLVIYPRARWPTANDFPSSVQAKNSETI